MIVYIIIIAAFQTLYNINIDMITEYYVASLIAECGNVEGKTTKEVELHY